VKYDLRKGYGGNLKVSKKSSNLLRKWIATAVLIGRNSGGRLTLGRNTIDER